MTVTDSIGVQEPLATWRERSRQPVRGWALVELVVAISIIVAGLQGLIPYSSTPWLLIAGGFFFWWRGPDWRAVGLRRPAHPARILLISVGVGVGYQFVGTYVVEPIIARLTGSLPDVSAFRGAIGDEEILLFMLALSWTLGAVMEEMVYRGWLMTRLAEIGRFTRSGWIFGALGSSAIFGAVHLYQGLSGIVANGLTGVVLACVYFATGRNLWACILAHGFLDTAAFLLIYFGVYPGL